MSGEFRSQADCRLRINTALDGKECQWDDDPVLLVAVTGEEWVSRPFEYTVMLWREVHLNEPGRPKGYILPQDRINTKVKFGIRIQEWHEVTHTEGDPPEDKTETVLKGYSYTYTCGVFEKFNYEGTVGGRFLQYTATIIPFQDDAVRDLLPDIRKPNRRRDTARLQAA